MPEIHGILLMATGAIHVLFGLLPMTYKTDWKKFVQSGLWNTVTIKNDRDAAAFWFVTGGILLFLMGMTLYELEAQVAALSISIGWGLLLLGFLGAVMTPKSGFTLFIVPQAILYLCSAYGVIG